MARNTELSLQRAVEIIKDIDFPTLPLYLQIIQTEMSRPVPSFPTIAQAVSQDIALTAKLLRTVNSPAFQTRSHIENTLQALTILGLDQFYEAVLSESLKSALHRQGLSKENFSILWHHASETAKASRFLAERITRSGELAAHINSTHAYLAGLFHDCGIPIMAARYPEFESLTVQAERNGEVLTAAESRLFDTDHSLISFIAAKMWNLPIPVRFALYCHHSSDLGYAGNREQRELAVILRCAEFFLQSTVPSTHPFLAEITDRAVLMAMLERELGIDESFADDLQCDLQDFLTADTTAEE